MTPKISVVTISFNQAGYIKDCIDSVISQLKPGDQYIVVDPGSTDGSRDIIDSYDSIERVYESDSGPADGLNKGFSQARNEYLYFINSDDLLLEGALDEIRKVLKKNDEIDVFCFSGFLVNKNLGKIRPMRSFTFSTDRMLMCSTTVFQQGVVFKRKAFENVGGFNQNNRTCWDAELLYDMSVKNKLFMDIDLPVALFRYHDTSITGSATNFSENKANKDRMFFSSYNRYPNFFDRLQMKINTYRKYFYLKYTFTYLLLRLKAALGCKT